MSVEPIETARLVLRNWQDSDRVPYAAFLADPILRKFFRGVVDPVTASNWIDGYIDTLNTTGLGWRAVVRKSDGALIGDAGVGFVDDDSRAIMRGAPLLEAGWTIGRAYWGQGYATEAAGACLAASWSQADIPEVVAAAHIANTASHRVMEKLGMQRDLAGDFEDPRFAAGHWLRPHVLYRLDRPANL
ncbi:MAG: GNAT family N-acetyltransferase [Proteobacteria bacterium]|nr:GNAT family N-acetyltransferase [Pseudomonadota bacterium]